MTAKKTETIVNIPLSQVVADYGWNGRYLGGGESPGWTVDSGAEDGDTNDFSALKTSIAERGQDTPVIVRPKGQKFALVAGFRRFKALEEIAKDKGDKEATVKAIVRELDDLQARLANARENTERQGYRPADLCWTVGQVAAEYARKKIDATQTMLATDFGQSQGYIAKLLGICKNLTPAILEDWRAQDRSIGVQQVYKLSQLPKNEQAKQWQDMKSKPTGKEAQSEANKGEKEAKAVEKLCEKAHEVGWTIGQLTFLGIVSCKSFDALEALEVCVDIPEKLGKTKKNLTKVAKALAAGFEAGNQEQEVEETEEAEAAE